MRNASLAIAALIALGAGAASPPALADPVPADATWEEATIESADGTQLHADVFRPKALDGSKESEEGPRSKDSEEERRGKESAERRRGKAVDEERKTPVIVIVSPYLSSGSGDHGSRPTILPYYRDLFDVAFDRGYAIVQVALRGQGGSDGCPDLGGKGEQGDAKAAVEWAASRPWSTGRVGMWGLSYDGLTQVMNLANRPRGLRAAVIMGPAIDQYRVLFMNGVPYARGQLINPYYFGLSLLPPALLPVSDRPPFDAGPPSDPLCLGRLTHLQERSAIGDPNTDFWRERNFIRRAARSRVAVLWSHGFFDEQTYPSSFMAVWRRLQGPHRAWFGQFPHVVASEAENGNPGTLGRSGFTSEAMRWLDHYVAGKPGGRTKMRRYPPVEVQEGSAGRWRGERRWPPADARALTLPVRPGQYVDASGNKAYPGCFRVELSCPPGPSGIGSWSISQPLPHAMHLAGVPRLRVQVVTSRPNATLIAILYDIDADGAAAYVSRGARLLPASGRYQFNLYPQDWRLEAGHRIGLLITGADDLWFTPRHTGSPVRVTEATLRVPFLRRDRQEFLEGGASDAVRQRQTFPASPAIAAGWVIEVPVPPPMRGADD